MRFSSGASRRLASTRVLALGSLLLAGCAASAVGSTQRPPPVRSSPVSTPPAKVEPPSPAPSDGGWITNAHPSLRQLTVLVRVKPPDELGSAYRDLAKRIKPLATLFSSYADEGFGSGFVMVRREGAGSQGSADLRLFVVTNRHVVGLSSDVNVTFDGVEGAFAAQVVYVDELYDLAVLALPAPGPTTKGLPPLASGFGIERAPVQEQDLVVASGYPGIAGTPSYQVTRGYVSNDRFLFNEGDGDQRYVQHTAPIDPGSSGGPLTSQDGKVLGVNTLKVRDRENVGLAVPAPVIEAALERAVRAENERVTRESPAAAQSACERILRDLTSSTVTLAALERSIGAGMIADQGLASLPALPADQANWPGRFVERPTDVFLRAIALRLRAAATSSAPGAASNPTCEPTETPAGAAARSFRVQLAGGERVWSFGLEQARWKLTRGALYARGGRSFLDELERSSAPRPKWKPSLK